MIEKTYFIEQLKNASYLINCLIKRDSAELMYNRLKFSDERDFDRAVDDLIEQGERLSYALLKQSIGKHMSYRIERENAERKKSEDETFKALWNSRLKEEECGHQCFACKKTYCNKVSNAALSGIKSVLLGEKTIEDMNKYMAERFPGLGFDSEIQELQPF